MAVQRRYKLIGQGLDDAPNDGSTYARQNEGWVSFTPGSGGASNLIDLGDVADSTATNRNVLVADGTDWHSRALTEADISDLGTYITQVFDDATPVLAGNLDADGRDITNVNSLEVFDADSSNNTLFIGPLDNVSRGNSNDGFLALFGENAATLYGARIGVVSSNMQINPYTSLGHTGISQLQLTTGVNLQIFDSTDTDSFTIDQTNADTRISSTQNIWFEPDASTGHSVYVWDPSSTADFRVYDGAGTDYFEVNHDGTSVNITGVNTLNFEFTGASNVYRFDSPINVSDIAPGSLGIVMTSSDSHTSGTLNMPLLRWREADGTITAGIRAFTTNGTDQALSLGVGNYTEKFRIYESNVSTNYVGVMVGTPFHVYDSTNADFAIFSHDGTDFNTTFNGTTDWNIDFLTGDVVLGSSIGLQVGGAITATSYGGITEANLVDKTASETIEGNWDFQNFLSITDDGVSPPTLEIHNSIGATDAKFWQLRTIANRLAFTMLSDDRLTEQEVLTINRTSGSGTTPEQLRLLDGLDLWIYGPSGFNRAEMSHDDTDFTMAASINTEDFIFSGWDLINCSDIPVTQAVMEDYSIQSPAELTVSANAVTVNYNQGNAFEIDLEAATGTVTVTISGGPPTGTMGEMVIKVKQDSTADRNITWAGGTFVWANNTTLQPLGGSDAITQFYLNTWDGGTTWYITRVAFA